MTFEEVRTSPDHLTRMGEVLSDPLVQDVLSAIDAEMPPTEANADHDPVVSVRILSRLVGFTLYRQHLRDSATRYVPEPEAPEATYAESNDL